MNVEQSAQTVSGAYARIEDHESRCLERYETIHATMAELKGLLKWLVGGVGTIFFGLMCWMGVQLYTLEPLRIAAAARLQADAREARTVIRDDAREARSEALAPPVERQKQ